jgi:hypothetical protein
MVIEVLAEKEGRRVPGPVLEMPSFDVVVVVVVVSGAEVAPFWRPRATSCSLRSPGDRRSSGVGANDELVLEVSDEMIGARRRCEAASSAASEMDMADAFLRVLKANFLGGLKVWRIVCSFSERALMAWNY